MSDEFDIERRRKPSRANERARTAIGCTLLAAGLGLLFLALDPVTRDLNLKPTLTAVFVLACGCVMIVPETFLPFFGPIIEKIPLLKRNP